MDLSLTFTIDEKRLVLSEIIKTSNVDVQILASFVAQNGIRPNLDQWVLMQIPQGRNVSQCMQVAEYMIGGASNAKRKWTHDMTAEANPASPPASKRSTGMTHYDYRASTSPRLASKSSVRGPVNILPRIDNNGTTARSRVSAPAPGAAPKKRGRPSRADKAKRDLRPLLPQHMAPRSAAYPEGNDLRPLLPAPTNAPRAQRSLSATSRDSSASNAPSRTGRQSVDMGRPRIMSNGMFEATENHQNASRTDLPPIEPHLLRHGYPQSSPRTLPLPPMLHHGSLAPKLPDASPHDAAPSTTVVNSA